MALQVREKSGARRIRKTLTVLRSAEDLYGYWRDFEHLPQFMDHVESVTVLDDKRSHWVAKAPLGQTVEWDAEIHEERTNEYITWRSLSGSQVEHSGEVRFRPASGDRGTEVSVMIRYVPPGGRVGATIAKLFGEEPSQQLDEDLYRFKQIMEAGRIPTIAGQPHGQRQFLAAAMQRMET
ncbi:MAG: SRPBCC family protein [Dehalococcoidia bacterium]